MTIRIRRPRRRPLQKNNRGLTFEPLEVRRMLAGDLEFRSFDGTGNNDVHDQWGSVDTQLVRLTTASYGEGTAGAFPAMVPRLDSAGNTINPRTVSNYLFDQDAELLNDRGLTGFTFQWGQFLDHDMDLTEDFLPVGEATLPGEFVPFFVTDAADELPLGSMIPFLRSRFEFDDAGVAQQLNQITSYIDSSNVYGSDTDKAEGLRVGFGGLLLTSDGISNLGDGSGDFLPFNTLGLENASPPTTGTGVPITPDELFIAGDVRSNEQPGLTSMHTLFMREHNYQAQQIAAHLNLDETELTDPEVDEYVYQLARAITNAEMQSITYNEFIPSLLGPNQLATYQGYNDNVNASIANIFSASLYRVGHTMLPNELLMLESDGSPVPDASDVLGASVENGELDLGEAFFNPQLVAQFGIEPFLKGLAVQQIQEIDNLIVDGVRNLLFDPPAAIDLGATNIQRGRDHGLPDYNQARIDFGLDPVSSFSQISSNASAVAGLESAYDAINDGVNGYDAINNIDVFAGALSEDQIAGGSIGELLHSVLVDQFTRLRDGDRFFYENVFSGSLLKKIQNTRLSDIIRRTTDLQNVQDEVFRSDNVFTYRAEEGRGNANLTLRARHGQLQVVRGNSNRVIAAQSLAETDIVVIYGTSKNDSIRIDGSVAAAFAGSVELHGGGGNADRLIVSGTNLADTVVVAPTEISVNNLSFYYGNFEKVIVKAGGGDDFASVDGMLNVSLTMSGGRGNDVLVGGSGNDILLGGRGRDILVGGAGIDILNGGSGQDILVGGTTSSDLSEVRTVWTSGMSYHDRVEALREILLSEDDGDLDFIFGGFGRDWFLLNPLDWAFDRNFGEAIN